MMICRCAMPVKKRLYIGKNTSITTAVICWPEWRVSANKSAQGFFRGKNCTK